MNSPGQTGTQLLQIAVQRHQAGNLQEAEAIYQRVLQIEPDNEDALHFSGLIAFQAGKIGRAIELIRKAISIKPSSPMYYNLGLALKAQGDLGAAIESYQKALLLKPDYVEAQNNLGNVYKELGRLSEAATCFHKVLSLKPNYAEAHNNLGNVYKEQGRLDEASACFHKALSLRPDYAEAHNNLGNLYKEQDRLDEAVLCFHKALSLKPNSAETHNNLGNALRSQGKMDEAIISYQKALALRPNFAEAHNNLGNALKDQGRLDEAIMSFQKALSLKPGFTEVYNNLENAFKEQGRQEEAVACLQQAQSLEPTHFEWKLRTLGVLLPFLTESRSQISALRSRLASETERLLTQEGTVHTLERAPFNLFSLAYQGADDRPHMEQIAKLVRAKAPALSKSLLQNASSRHGDERIRLGFLSSRLHAHTIGKLTQGYIRNIDRDRFHVTVIHAPGGHNDRIRHAINSMADEVVCLPPRIEAAQQVVADLGLDVLHYPDIGMSPYTYFLAYARLAPVQTVSWGHPVTTGLDTIDYFLSFGAAEPEGAENHYTETLVRLNRAPAYYEPLALPTQAESRSALGLPDSGRLYGCLQTLMKFHPDFDAVLADIVARDPQARIIAIEDNAGYLRKQLSKRWATACPVLLERVIFLPRQPTSRFMMLLSCMDVQLDTPHFGSGNTLYESMVYGIPIITWPGSFMRGRFVAGVYQWLGIADAPIATTLDDYAPLAVAFATDRERHEALKQQLIEKSPAIYQDELAVRELETFFEQAVAASRRDEKLRLWPSGFSGPTQQNPSSGAPTS